MVRPTYDASKPAVETTLMVPRGRVSPFTVDVRVVECLFGVYSAQPLWRTVTVPFT